MSNVSKFIFATGIENSIPTIRNGSHRVDQYQSCGHYDNWKLDFGLVKEMGMTHLRYGAPLHTTWLGEGRYDWSFADETFAELRRLGITPIMDLCHFGLPDWLGTFQNPDFPKLFSGFARAFAARYPWVRHYTPVNEMFVCATFSAKFGWWNEQTTDDVSYARAIKHIAMANLAAMEAILEVRPDATFVQSESIEYVHAEHPSAKEHADRMNAIRFIALDLTYGRALDPLAREFMVEGGMTDIEESWFKRHVHRGQCVLGLDYYITCERYARPDGTTYCAGDVRGFADLTLEYYDRYRLPLMHSETNMAGTEAVNWLNRQWAAARSLLARGVPLLGFTWYSLGHQMDWQVGLREDNGEVHPVGLYDMDRNITEVGVAYRGLIADWEALPLAA